MSPQRDRVIDALGRAGVRRLAAVIPLHSHYDHALGSPLVAELTGATLRATCRNAAAARRLDETMRFVLL